MKIGVLGLQGAVDEHIKQITSLGLEGIAIKQPYQIKQIDGLILPGGESTTISRLINRYGFSTPIKEFSKSKKPIFGTCAGMVLLAKELTGSEDSHLGLMDICVKRNAFGRQRDSFEAKLDIKGLDNPFTAVFIRAPYVESVEPHVEVLATYNEHIIAARQGHMLVSSFHPELTEDTRLLELFVDMVTENQEKDLIIS